MIDQNEKDLLNFINAHAASLLAGRLGIGPRVRYWNDPRLNYWLCLLKGGSIF